MRDEPEIGVSLIRRKITKLSKTLIERDNDPDFQAGVWALEKMIKEELDMIRQRLKN